MSAIGRGILSSVERAIASEPRRPNALPRFLASRPLIHRALGAALRSRPCRVLVADLCFEAALKYGDVDPWDALRSLSAYRRFSEDSRINAISEICERADPDGARRHIAGALGNLGPEQKAALLERVFYNFILIGLDRKVAALRGAEAGGAVPNLSAVLLSLCSTCNLQCIDCESADDRGGPDATSGQIDYAIAQARRLNVFHVVIIGKGEPFLGDARKELVFRTARKHPDLNFIVFTNGTTLEEGDIVRMRELRNFFALVSLDGLEETNDRRRGRGVYARAAETLGMMKRHGVLCGFSATVFKWNYRHVLSDEFLAAMSALGCRIGVYLSYIPLSGAAGVEMTLGDGEREEYEALYARASGSSPIPLLDPELFERPHGCRAKRGSVVYIDAATGKVMPCVKTPFAPESCNLYTRRHRDRLREILQSDFYVNYRNLYETCGQCSVDLQGELARYVTEPSVSERDRERADRFRRKTPLSSPPRKRD
ncbi:MAG TPA: radical SAM protein [Candidatus Krumholzibacteriaceae bacterium]